VIAALADKGLPRLPRIIPTLEGSNHRLMESNPGKQIDQAPLVEQPRVETENGPTVPVLDALEMEADAPTPRGYKFGTFQGVFTPTLLTILGVIMYLRAPWVVGNAGIIGAIGIITLATAITFFTALSMSSIVTNIRIRAGGAFSIISQSLGLEAGGAIGIPLYIAQAFAVAMYVFGFREGWLWVFPDHPAMLVDLATFGFIFLIANISTDFAFKIQYAVLAIIALSLVSIAMGFINNPVNTDVRLFGAYEGTIQDNAFEGVDFWIVFAVFFPAVTGIMAGANMSGDLKDPRTSIPRGTLAAIGLSYFVYVALVVAVAFLATPRELLVNYNILIDKAFFAPLVLAGLLGATFSSALSSLVGAPRILFALGENNILFMNRKLGEIDKKGEPKFAFYFTSVIVVLTLLFRDLNAIAPLLTMFFLITYAMINVVVLIEQGLGQISFRPMLKVPILVPLMGAIGCFFVMFIINAIVGFISIGLVVAMYVYLTKRKNLDSSEGDTRSGMFNSLAEWSAKVINRLPEARERSWQPNMLVPAREVHDIIRSYKTIYNLARPKGAVKILGFITEASEGKKMAKRLPELSEYFQEQNISASTALVQSDDYVSSLLTAMQSLKASFFTPNTLFISLTDDESQDADIAVLLTKAKEYGFGAYLFVPFRKIGLGLEKTINLWLDIRKVNREIQFKVDDINIAILTAYLLKRNWEGKLNIIVITKAARDMEKEMASARKYVTKLMTLSRIPHTAIHYVHGSFIQAVEDMPRADLNILPFKAQDIDLTKVRKQSRIFETSLLYTMDGGGENALA
jgi:solute carrier family 12 sodium/potassium/chloride transporter 2